MISRWPEQRRSFLKSLSCVTVFADAWQDHTNVDEILTDARVQDALHSLFSSAVDTPSLKILDNLSDNEEFEIMQHGYSQVKTMVLHFQHRSSDPELPSKITAEMWREWQQAGG